MTRTETREYAVELLYSLEMQKDDEIKYDEQIEMYLKGKEIENEKAIIYITETLNGIKQNQEEIMKLISKNLSEKWDIARVSKIDITLLKLSTFEIAYAKLPYKVVVNEVVEIAKKYGDKSSPAFVNGVLANIIKQLNLANEE